MTTFDPDTLEQNVEVLRKIRREFAGTMALNCYVIETGKIAVGDEVELLPHPDPLPGKRGEGSSDAITSI